MFLIIQNLYVFINVLVYECMKKKWNFFHTPKEFIKSIILTCNAFPLHVQNKGATWEGMVAFKCRGLISEKNKYENIKSDHSFVRYDFVILTILKM